MGVIWLQSGWGDPPSGVRKAASEGRARIVLQEELQAEDLAAARGLITGNQLDQDALLRFSPALEAFLDAGGRWFFNGHLLRPLIAGPGLYRPMPAPKRADFDQTRLAPHPVFDGVDIHKLETNKGVAGFYGRGANAMPEGAIAITGLRGGTVPVDWVWPRPRGGRFFSHAGNDLGAAGMEWQLAPLFQGRIIDWAGGGACLG